MSESCDEKVGVLTPTQDPGCIALLRAEIAKLELENGFFLASYLIVLKNLVTRLEVHLKATF